MRAALVIATLLSTSLLAQTPAQPDWAKVDEETLKHFLAIVKMDTTDPPGGEKPVVEEMDRLAIFPRDYPSMVLPDQAVLEVVTLAACG